MRSSSDRKFGWIAGFAYASGLAVIVPSLAALAIALVAVIFVFF